MPLFRSRSAFSKAPAPCLPTLAKAPPEGPEWVHEIKHDGFRLLALKKEDRVSLYSRQGRTLTYRFPLIVGAIVSLPVKSVLLDGEAIVCDLNGLAVFDKLRHFRNGPSATLCAFDLLEVDGSDWRIAPIEERKRRLKQLLGKRAHKGISYNRHFDVEGSVVFHHARKLGCEGIVSKRLGSPYKVGRSSAWLKVKNPDAPAAKRETEEKWW